MSELEKEDSLLAEERGKDIENETAGEEQYSEEEVEESIRQLEDAVKAAGETDSETPEDDMLEDERYRELNDKYIRLYADFENYRKRMVKEKEEIQKYGYEPLLYELLTVIDTLEMALGHADSDDASASLKQGIEMTLKEFQRVLGKFGLERIEALGKKFDPEQHEAMTRVKRDDVEDGVIVEEFRKGYMFYDRLLRPALVAVASPDGEAPHGGGEKEESGADETNN